jgi:hypothetical protein
MTNFVKTNHADTAQFPSTWVDQIKTGDFNGDGKADFVVSRLNNDLGTTATPLQVYLGDGHGNFTDQTALVFKDGTPTVHWVPRMIVTDFNGDGVSDLFCIDQGIDKLPYTGGQNALFLSSGGKLSTATSNLPQGLTFNHGASVADVNKDGHLDILDNALMFDGNDLQVQDSSGRFVSSPSLMPNLAITNPYSGVGTLPQTNTFSGLIDVNGDGFPDMILGDWDNATSSKTSQVFLNNGHGSFAGVSPINLPKSGVNNEIVLDVKPIDLNGDGLPDLALSITSGGDASTFYRTAYVQLLVNDGNGKFHDETSARLPQSMTASASGTWYKSIEVVDINHDGFSDMVLDDDNASAKVMLNDGKGNFNLIETFQYGKKVAVGDVNNDGMSDLIVESSSGGFDTYINTMTNGRIYKANFGGDTLHGSSGADTFISGDGNDKFTGNGGTDVVKMHGVSSNYTITSANGITTVKDSANVDGTDTLINISRVQFTDKTVALDISGNAGQAYRVYQAAFDRKPDSSGLKYWIGAMDNGGTLDQVASGFLASTEFTNLYGANPTVDQFVTKLYSNVLHRAPEQAGHDYWVNSINSGAITKTQALVGFSESTENQVAVIGVIQNGIDLTN